MEQSKGRKKNSEIEIWRRSAETHERTTTKRLEKGKDKERKRRDENR